MINEQNVIAHYNKNNLYKKIEDGLLELGVSLDAVCREDLNLVDDFHIGGSAATHFILENLSCDQNHSILDIGCGIGGPARYMAEKSGGNVCGVDLTGAYIEVGTQLNDLVRLGEKVSLRQGSALSLPYEVSSFDGAYMIHVGMNIERKEDLMREASRVLKAGKKFVLFDVMKISNEDIKLLQNFYNIVFSNQNFRSNIENLDKNFKKNKYIKTIVDFINSDKKRPISLPINKNEDNR